jgi:tripartite-type tricarboxylate transporter receptor subunit TctC
MIVHVRKRFLGWCRLLPALLCLSVMVVTSAHAQSYPARPVKLIVPYSAGGGTDLLGRLIAEKLAELWAQPVVVENHAGADAMIGTEMVARAKPDGYTIVLIAPTHALNPSTRRSMPYDSVKDFAPITMVAQTPFALAVSNDLPARSVSELVALAKARPGKLTFGSAESSSRLAGELFKTLAGVDILNVPYKAISLEMTDLVGAHIDMGFASLTSFLQHHNSGTLRLLAVSGDTRSPLAPNVPTMAEAGFSGWDIAAWYGLLAPGGTPPSVITKIQQDVAQVTRQPDVQQKLLKLGAVPVPSTPEAFSKFLVAEIARSSKILSAAGIYPE